MMNVRQNKKLFLFILIGVLFISFFVFSFFKNSFTDEEHSLKFQNNYCVYSLNIPDTLDFAGERLPMENFDIREALDRELLVNTYWQSQTMVFIKKANRYFPVIESILKEYGIPDDFKYLPLIESGLSNVISPADAVGIWQILSSTAKENGLEVNAEVDERYHIEKSTIAACKFLKSAYNIFGNWTLAAASYNAGKSRIQEHVTTQKTNNYYDIWMNAETSRYIFRIVSIKIILSNSEKYGFHIRKKDLYPEIPTRKVKIDTTISDLIDFAQKNGTNYKLLKLLNPWLRSDKLTVHSGNSYEITLPLEGARNSKMMEE